MSTAQARWTPRHTAEYLGSLAWPALAALALCLSIGAALSFLPAY